MVSPEQKRFFENNGYLIVRDFLSRDEIDSLQSWAQEVHDYVPDETSDIMPYEVRILYESPFRSDSLQEINAEGKRVLCRTENFADGHQGFNDLLNGDKLLGLLDALSGQPMRLFKEKINYKLAGSGTI